MNFWQRVSLMWRRFSPLEERLLAAVREVLSTRAQRIFEAQIAGITLVRRHPNEIFFYRMVSGKVDWSGIPAFPRTGEFRLAEVQFDVGARRYKATLSSIRGHVFDFTITPSSNAIAFTDWDSAASTRLLSDPMTPETANEPQPLPESWREILARMRSGDSCDWTLHDAKTAYRTVSDDFEFLVLAEREGDQFLLHRIEPPASTLFYLDSHDGTPEPINGDILEVFGPHYHRNG